MFPIRDDNPSVIAPVATWTLIACNLFMWGAAQGFGMSAEVLQSSVCSLGLIPGELLGTLEAGAEASDALCRIGAPNWLTVLTSMFLHGSWFHLLANLWFLWIFGNNVEDSMGHVRFVVFYLLCGLAAAGLQVAADPSSAIPMVGASGAIGGVMGAYVLLYPRVHVYVLIILGFYVTTVAVPAMLMLGYWFVLQLVGGFGSLTAEGGGVAFWAHVGGFVAGAVLVLVFRNPRLLARHPYHGWKAQHLPSQAWHRVR
jgi:membrane associated rhomboid family serine protease